MEQPDLTDQFVELIRLASTDLRSDVEDALHAARDREEEGSAAQAALDTILENIRLARANSTPICQDTGTPIFYIYFPTGWSTLKLRHQVREATATATAKSYLRPNAVDPVTGKKSRKLVCLVRNAGAGLVEVAGVRLKEGQISYPMQNHTLIKFGDYEFQWRESR